MHVFLSRIKFLLIDGFRSWLACLFDGGDECDGFDGSDDCGGSDDMIATGCFSCWVVVEFNQSVDLFTSWQRTDKIRCIQCIRSLHTTQARDIISSNCAGHVEEKHELEIQATIGTC